MANTYRCAGCGQPTVPAGEVLCTPCTAHLATSVPISWAAPTVNVAELPTLRVPTYVQPLAVA